MTLFYGSQFVSRRPKMISKWDRVNFFFLLMKWWIDKNILNVSFCQSR